jgi:hypothetical protein
MDTLKEIKSFNLTGQGTINKTEEKVGKKTYIWFNFLKCLGKGLCLAGAPMAR